MTARSLIELCLLRKTWKMQRTRFLFSFHIYDPKLQYPLAAPNVQTPLQTVFISVPLQICHLCENYQ